jgi:hypothetical protein
MGKKVKVTEITNDSNAMPRDEARARVLSKEEVAEVRRRAAADTKVVPMTIDEYAIDLNERMRRGGRGETERRFLVTCGIVLGHLRSERTMRNSLELSLVRVENRVLELKKLAEAASARSIDNASTGDLIDELIARGIRKVGTALLRVVPQ